MSSEGSDVDFYYDDDDEMIVDDDEGSAISEDDMDGIDTYRDDYAAQPSSSKRKIYEVEFDTLPQEAVEGLIRKDVEYISSILGVETDAASLLLRHMNWNKEKLIERYMEDSAAQSAKAGIAPVEPPPAQIPPSSSRSSSSRSVKTSSAPKRVTRRTTAESALKAKALLTPEPSVEPESFLCPICCDDSQPKTLSLVCDHKFCADCWVHHLKNKIRVEGDYSIKCMASGCTLIATDSFVTSTLAEEPESVERYKELIVRSFVAANKALKFCPYPSCTYTVSCPNAATKSALTQMVPTVHCATESHKFCFGCPIESDHRPVICGVAKMWLKKCEDDSETANWIKSNTKECSKCQSTIEKNGGCNHMTCRKCKYEFCWVCMGPWSEHGTTWYSCNRFDEASGIEARDAQARSRASLERYLHYYNRWANHEQSAKLSADMYAKTEKKMEEMQITSNLSWIEVQFAKKAADELFKCRMTLKWTYAMAYYLQKDNEKEIFEANQSDLEQAVESLTELLESPIEAEDIPVLRQKMTDKTVYVQKRSEIMLEDTAKGFLENRWRWNVNVDGFEPATVLAD
ncbi:hypothetical protein SCHPADRAFT_901105 [Schizopora paradoxa]|uniref:RBR-type E3 ubiquitin transferase n=1 Tax=Schizopora paradoxa TaxID=27342 RepID=A0A0H2S5P8_9AGAM|nr:hypothetical protein SCHPADRAFT_901105 [Schizopora paradoxa]